MRLIMYLAWKFNLLVYRLLYYWGDRRLVEDGNLRRLFQRYLDSCETINRECCTGVKTYTKFTEQHIPAFGHVIMISGVLDSGYEGSLALNLYDDKIYIKTRDFWVMVGIPSSDTLIWNGNRWITYYDLRINR